MTTRPLPVIIAAILMVLIGLANLPGPLLPGAEDVPDIVNYSAIVLGVVGLVAAVGLWMLKKWGLWLTIVVSVLNFLSAAPGIIAAPNAMLQVGATVTSIVSVVIVVLVVLQGSRRAFAAH